MRVRDGNRGLGGGTAIREELPVDSVEANPESDQATALVPEFTFQPGSFEFSLW